MKRFFLPLGHCARSDPFLPDFCQPKLIFSAFILGQLLALVLLLSPLGKIEHRWLELGFFSLAIHLISLTSMLVLCLSRKWLCQLNNTWATLLSFGIILSVAGLWSEIIWHLLPTRISFTPPLDQAWDSTIYVRTMALKIQSSGEVQVYEHHKHLLFLFRNLGISAIVGGVALRYFYIVHQWKMKSATELEARMQALQSRMRPHFLFNTMNTIASLTRFDPEQAEIAVQDFSGLMRAALGDARNLILLSEEITLCQQYLRIESLRMGERLQVEWMLDMLPQDALVPSLSLQPLLENAVSYGIHPRPEGGIIQVNGLSDGHFIKIDVENPMPDNPPKRTGNKIAQANLRQRLEIYYGHQGRLETQAAEGYYRASLRFPYQKGINHEHTYRG